MASALTPIVHAVRSVSGEYSLVIAKSGAGGSSDVSQDGPFDAARGQTVELGTSEFTMERGAKFRAVLKVRAGGEVVCRDIRLVDLKYMECSHETPCHQFHRSCHGQRRQHRRG